MAEDMAGNTCCGRGLDKGHILYQQREAMLTHQRVRRKLQIASCVQGGMCCFSFVSMMFQGLLSFLLQDFQNLVVLD